MEFALNDNDNTFSTLRESRGCETFILSNSTHEIILSVLSASRGGVRRMPCI